ncbi:MAG: multidrug effflux MFS transporter [Alphaproteobacteria bacterium]
MKKLPVDGRLYPFALAALMSLGPFGIDMYLPSLPAMAVDFNSDAAGLQISLSLFMVCFGAGQIVTGPLADRYGRKIVAMGGLVLFCATSFLVAQATSLETLYIARMLQGLAASCGPIASRAFVRDNFDGSRAAAMFGYLGAIMAIVPMLAPILGGLMQEWWGWQATFWFMGGAALLIAMVYLLFVEESLTAENMQPIRPLVVLRNFGELLTNRYFLNNVLVVSLMFGGLMAFINGSSFVMQDVYGLSPFVYSLVFGLNVVGFMTGTIMTSRLSTSWGSERLVRIGMTSLFISAFVQMIPVLLDMQSVPTLVVAQFFGSAGFGLCNAQFSARILQPFPRMAGTAAALSGTLQLGVAGAISAIPGFLFDGTGHPFAYVVAGSSIAGVLIWYFTLRGRAAPDVG